MNWNSGRPPRTRGIATPTLYPPGSIEETMARVYDEIMARQEREEVDRTARYAQDKGATIEETMANAYDRLHPEDAPRKPVALSTRTPPIWDRHVPTMHAPAIDRSWTGRAPERQPWMVRTTVPTATQTWVDERGSPGISPRPATLLRSERLNPPNAREPFDLPVAASISPRTSGPQIAMAAWQRPLETLRDWLFEQPVPPQPAPTPPKLPPPHSTLKPEADAAEREALMEELLWQEYESRYGMSRPTGDSAWALMQVLMTDYPDVYNYLHDLVYGLPFRSREWGPQPQRPPLPPEPSRWNRFWEAIWKRLGEGPGLPTETLDPHGSSSMPGQGVPVIIPPGPKGVTRGR